MDIKKIGMSWVKLIAFIVPLVILPVLTAIPVAKTYEITAMEVYLWFGMFYVLTFVIIIIPAGIKYIARQEVYNVLREEKLIKKNDTKK